MPSVSAILITRNEIHNLADCLAGLSWCNEVIVMDSGSTDGSAELARQLGARVQCQTDWPGFGPQKNRALDLAQGEWVLSIDADERVTPALAEEIQAAIGRADAPDAFSLPRLSSYCGQFMRHGGWYPDRVVRLFRRGKARFSDDIVHESVQVQGPVGQLRHDLLHISYRSLDDVLEKMNRYSSAGAEKLASRGRRASLATALGKSLWAFIRTYLLRRGFLDGRLGFVLACSVAQETWYRYLKLWLAQRPVGENKNHLS
ncbi:MAG: glycosyltransferase family 2 protein [Thiomonas sp.]|uniref:glycosyltransferase family 2 protein n=1 Tax=Thiomonas sp. TaxID=2047785 RepID=UPI002A36C205|nr:glycosyltransferase family 2 protein [Thiomonas sp.]MDY0330241.1 glycosyltransferase family 2 protein [Thiomonas sp.]